MTTPLDLETLRRLLLEQPESMSTRVIGLLVSTAFLLAVLHLVRRGRLVDDVVDVRFLFDLLRHEPLQEDLAGILSALQ